MLTGNITIKFWYLGVCSPNHEWPRLAAQSFRSMICQSQSCWWDEIVVRQLQTYRYCILTIIILSNQFSRYASIFASRDSEFWLQPVDFNSSLIQESRSPTSHEFLRRRNKLVCWLWVSDSVRANFGDEGQADDLLFQVLLNLLIQWVSSGKHNCCIRVIIRQLITWSITKIRNSDLAIIIGAPCLNSPQFFNKTASEVEPFELWAPPNFLSHGCEL